MSIKVKQVLIKCLRKIENDTFDEDTIRTLLITSREYIKNEGLIKELAHFIAHPVRDRGIFHSKLNNRYTKLKLTDEEISKYTTSEILKNVKNEDELSDLMLGGVSVEKIDSKLFKILYIDGLDDLPDSHLKKYTGFNKKEIRDFFKKQYVQRNGYHYIKTKKTEWYINAIRRLPISKYDPVQELELTKQLVEAENLAKKIKSTMDRIQKVVRGAIFYNSVFETSVFASEIVNVFSQIVDRFALGKNYVKAIKKRVNHIMLCIMTLLHDAKFIFYDKNVANAALCFYLDYDPKHSKMPNFNLSEELYENGVIALFVEYVNGERKTTIPLYVSNLKIKDFLDYETYKSNPIDSYNSEIIWISANRIDNKLQLV